MRNDVTEPDTAGGAIVMSRDMVDTSVATSWTNWRLGFSFSEAQFLLLGQGWLAFLPIRFLVIARRVDVVLGDDLASFF